MKTYKCVECGREFTASQQAKYCCPACKSRHQNHVTAKVQCIFCGKIFIARKANNARFCSNTCASKARTYVTEHPESELARFVKPRSAPTTIYKRYCIDCGKQFETRSPKTVNRRCEDCLRLYRKRWASGAGELLQEVISTTGYERQQVNAAIDALLVKSGVDVQAGPDRPSATEAQTYLPLTKTREEHNAKRRADRARRKALGLLAEEHDRTGYRKKTLERCGAVCSVCGYADYIDALVAHHLDMNRANNREDNLVVMCSNCHGILHRRVARNMSLYEDKKQGIVNEYHKLKAEVKSRNEAGNPDRATRTEGCEESQSGATHTGTSSTDMSRHEAATEDNSEKIC